MSSATPPRPSSHAAILSSIAAGEPVNGSVPPATLATLPGTRVTLIPPTSIGSIRSNLLVTVIACAGLFTVRVNLPLSSGENETFECEWQTMSGNALVEPAKRALRPHCDQNVEAQDGRRQNQR